MNKQDFKKGQEIFLRVVPGSNAGRMRGIDKATAWNDYDTTKAAIGQQIITGEVISAGRKYITVAVEGRPWNEVKFNVTNNFRQDHDNDYQLFLTWDDAVERIWRDALSHNLRRKFSSTLDTDLTLEQLQQITSVVNQNDTALENSDPEAPIDLEVGTGQEIESILQMLDERITNNYKVIGDHDNMLYLRSRKTGNEYTIKVEEMA